MKSKLRHPIRAIREPFGKAGLIVACLALVFAMVGGAYAAGKLTSKQKKEVEKIAKKFAGKPGTPGAPGSPGTAGANGKDGANGTNGTNGQSVTGAPIASGGACGTATGVKYTLGSSSTNVCSGANGADGKSVEVEEIQTGEPECGGEGGAFIEEEGGTTVEICNGQPWAAGGTLPKGRSESGVWSALTFENAFKTADLANSAISFGIPLNSAPTVLYVTEEGGPVAHCPGTVAAPAADEGFVCVYAEAPSEAFAKFETATPYVSGAYLEFDEALAPGFTLHGTWAVTSAG